MSIQQKERFILAALAALFCIAIPAELRAEQAGCPITPPTSPAFVPPFPPRTPANGFYHGTNRLWTLAYRDYSRIGVPSDQGYRVKWPWFAEDMGDEKSGPVIVISGKRLDAPAPPVIVEGGSAKYDWTTYELDGVNYPFRPSILIFPTGGCWQISAERKDTKLTLVIEIPDTK